MNPSSLGSGGAREGRRQRARHLREGPLHVGRRHGVRVQGHGVLVRQSVEGGDAARAAAAARAAHPGGGKGINSIQWYERYALTRGVLSPLRGLPVQGGRQ